jgi:outer membrane immunogenic protein
MFGRIATAALLLAASPAAASAADLVGYPTSTGKQLPVTSTTPNFDWNGFYAGVFGAYQHSPIGGDRFGIGIDAGIDTTFNFVLVGAEVEVTGLGSGAGGTSYAEALGRAGVLLGDDTLLYGAAGYGVDTGAPDESDIMVGGGLEYALSNAVSLRAQYLHGFPVTGANPKDEVTLGAQFHF